MLVRCVADMVVEPAAGEQVGLRRLGGRRLVAKTTQDRRPDEILHADLAPTILLYAVEAGAYPKLPLAALLVLRRHRFTITGRPGVEQADELDLLAHALQLSRGLEGEGAIDAMAAEKIGATGLRQADEAARRRSRNRRSCIPRGQRAIRMIGLDVDERAVGAQGTRSW